MGIMTEIPPTEGEIEEERVKKTTGQEAEKGTNTAISAKDWVSMVVGIIGIVFGAATLYFANVRKVDDLRIVIDNYPTLRNTGSGWAIEAKNNFIFMSS